MYHVIKIKIIKTKKKQKKKKKKFVVVQFYLWFNFYFPLFKAHNHTRGWRSGECTRFPPMCCPGSIPGPGIICGLSLCWFSTLRVLWFPTSAKTDTQLIRAGCWLCSKVMHGPHSGCQQRLQCIYAFSPNLLSCVLAVFARAISESYYYYYY